MTTKLSDLPKPFREVFSEPKTLVIQVEVSDALSEEATELAMPTDDGRGWQNKNELATSKRIIKQQS